MTHRRAEAWLTVAPAASDEKQLVFHSQHSQRDVEKGEADASFDPYQSFISTKCSLSEVRLRYAEAD